MLLLARTFLAGAVARHGRAARGFSDRAAALLVAHTWPGNVRELAHEVERACIISDGPLIDAGDLGPRVRGGPARRGGGSLAERYAELASDEGRLVDEAMAEAQGNLSEAARLLGITRMRMRRRRARRDQAVKIGNSKE